MVASINEDETRGRLPADSQPSLRGQLIQQGWVYAGPAYQGCSVATLQVRRWTTARLALLVPSPRMWHANPYGARASSSRRPRARAPVSSSPY